MAAAIQPVARHGRCHAAHLHGDPGYNRRRGVASTHCRQPGRHCRRIHLGLDQLFDLQRHRAPCKRVAGHLLRSHAISHRLYRDLYRGLVCVRGVGQPGHDHCGQDFSGIGRRGAAAHLAGDSPGKLPGLQARDGDGHVRAGRGLCPGHRPDVRRVDNGQLFLAVDLLHQHPRRPPGGPDGPRRGGRPSIHSERQAGQDRYGWIRLDGGLVGHAPGHSGQGTAGRLVCRGLDPLVRLALGDFHGCLHPMGAAHERADREPEGLLQSQFCGRHLSHYARRSGRLQHGRPVAALSSDVD